MSRFYTDFWFLFDFCLQASQDIVICLIWVVARNVWEASLQSKDTANWHSTELISHFRNVFLYYPY